MVSATTLGRPRTKITLCSRYRPTAAVSRGPARGPSHRCKQCNQGHRRHDFVVSVQLALPERRARLLIIRRSWVRASPAPPAVSMSDRRWPWTDVGGAIHPAVIAVRSHRVAVERVWRAKAYGGKDRTGCLPGSPGACGIEQCVLPRVGYSGMARCESPDFGFREVG
jgi:hypothetical protein